jgi:hypothetical protein
MGEEIGLGRYSYYIYVTVEDFHNLQHRRVWTQDIPIYMVYVDVCT